MSILTNNKKHPLDFIDLVTPDGHNTSISFGGRLDVDAQWLTIVGALPHNSQIRPTTANERDRLIKVLKNLEYTN